MYSVVEASTGCYCSCIDGSLVPRRLSNSSAPALSFSDQHDHHPTSRTAMDPSTLVACFDASFSPNANIRIASELELRKVCCCRCSSVNCTCRFLADAVARDCLRGSLQKFVHTSTGYDGTRLCSSSAYRACHRRSCRLSACLNPPRQ